MCHLHIKLVISCSNYNPKFFLLLLYQDEMLQRSIISIVLLFKSQIAITIAKVDFCKSKEKRERRENGWLIKRALNFQMLTLIGISMRQQQNGLSLNGIKYFNIAAATTFKVF